MRAVPPRTQAAKTPPRAALLTLIISLGLAFVGLVVTGVLTLASASGKAARLAAPLYVHPVTQTIPGPCPPGTKGVNEQSVTGQVCQQLAQGFSIRRVNDIHVQPAQYGGYEISISLLPGDRDAFADLTRKMAGRDVVFVARGKLVTATRVEAPITKGKILISGNFTRSDADQLVRELKGTR